MRSTLITIVCVGCWLTVTPVWAEDYALIVGVNDCPDFRLPNGSRPRPLRGAESDADAVADLWKRQFGLAADHVRVLKGRQATRAALQAEWERLARTLRPEDSLLFYFSGHGTQVPDRKPFDEPDHLDEALCPSDARSDGTNLLLDDDLGAWLDEIAAGQVTILLDCCHAGTGIKEVDDEIVARFLPMPDPRATLKPDERPWRDFQGTTKSLTPRSVVALFACRPEQQAYERRMTRGNDTIRAGQFTHFVVEGLTLGKADRNGDQIVSRQELTDYVARRLDETFNAQRPQAVERQQPLLETDHPEQPLFSKLIKPKG